MFDTMYDHNVHSKKFLTDTNTTSYVKQTVKLQQQKRFLPEFPEFYQNNQFVAQNQ
jgi:hypothetical protein